MQPFKEGTIIDLREAAVSGGEKRDLNFLPGS